jgi:cell division septal protein FtsQ
MSNRAVRNGQKRVRAEGEATGQPSAKPPMVIKLRRQRAKRGFIARVVILVTAIVGVGYASWLAPWARHVHNVEVRALR